MSSLESSCTVISSGILLCVDQITQSLYTLPLQSEEMTEMRQIHLQVYILLRLYLTYSAFSVFCNYLQYHGWPIFSKTLDLEVASGFQPVLTSTQPNPAQQPLSEFFLQLSPDHHILLQLKDGLIALLRDFNPVRTNTSQSETEPFIYLQFLFIKLHWLQKFYWLLFTQSLKPNVLHISVISGCFCHIWREDSCCCDVPKEWYCESHLKKNIKMSF